MSPETNATRQLRWGVLSTSDFAERRFIPGLRKSSILTVHGVASRDLLRAQAFAARCEIPVAYGSYEEMLADPNIDIIYNPLPNNLHVEWTRKAAEAAKHVLCEKPMGMTADEVASLLPLASRVHIAEAFMVRQHPQWTQVREIIRRGELGRVTHAHIAFAYTNTDETNIRNIEAVGGGAMYDIGCYAVVAARWFLEAEPVRVAAVKDVDPRFGTDRLTSALLDFGDGRTCAFSVSTQSTPHQRVHLFGTKGRLELTIPFNQPQDASLTFFFHDGSSMAGLDAVPTVVPMADQYTLLAEWFCRKVTDEQPSSVGIDDAIANMRVIDAVFRSAASGEFVTV